MPENDGKIYGFCNGAWVVIAEVGKMYIQIDYEIEDRYRSNLCVTPCGNLLMYRLWQEEKKESARLSDNMKSLCTGLEEYKIRDSLNVVENHVLRLNIEELKELRSADAKLIKELNLRPKKSNISQPQKLSLKTVLYLF